MDVDEYDQSQNQRWVRGLALDNGNNRTTRDLLQSDLGCELRSDPRGHQQRDRDQRASHRRDKRDCACVLLYSRQPQSKRTGRRQRSDDNLVAIIERDRRQDADGDKRCERNRQHCP